MFVEIIVHFRTVLCGVSEVMLLIVVVSLHIG